MTIIIFTLLIFLDLVKWLIIFDVILSWLQLFGLKFRPKFIENILNPVYSFTRKHIPTRIGPFDLTPIILLIAIMFLNGLIHTLQPEIVNHFYRIVNNIN